MTAVPVHFCALMADNKEHTFVQTCQLHVDLQTSEKCLNVVFTVHCAFASKYSSRTVPLNVPLKQNMNKKTCIMVFCDWLILLFMTSQSPLGDRV